jgi:hypothetical protein
MKYLVLLSICLISFSSFAQKIKVTESEERIAGGKNPVLIVSIYESTVEEVGNKWRSLMKDYKGKVKMDDEIKSDNTVISAINDNNTIDISAKIEKVNDHEIKMTVAFYLGGAFLSSSNNKDKCNAAKTLLSDFAVKTTREAIAGIRKTAEKQFSALQDQQHDLEKKQEKLASSIEDYKQKIVDYNAKIKEAEDNTAKNKADQEKKKLEVAAQKKVVDDITAKEKAVE